MNQSTDKCIQDIEPCVEDLSWINVINRGLNLKYPAFGLRVIVLIQTVSIVLS